MGRLKSLWFLSAALAASLLLAWDSPALTAGTSCRQVLSTSPQNQNRPVQRVTVQRRAGDAVSPLGRPAVTVTCTARAAVTFGQAIARIRSGDSAVVSSSPFAATSSSAGFVTTSGPAATNASARNRANVAAVRGLLHGIAQSGDELGNPRAAVTMTYFGDFECPICQDFTLHGGFPELVRRDVRAGRVKIVFSAFCTATCNNRSSRVFLDQQIAAEAAGLQHRFWYYALLFLREQRNETLPYVTDAYLDGLARQTPGLDYAKWFAARSSKRLSRAVRDQEQAANSAGITGTPTLIFSGPNGKAQPPTSVPSYADIEAAIHQVS
jgi:protein-disulfide isomerase